MRKPTEYIKESINIFKEKENLIFFVKIMAVLVLISTSFAYLFSYFFPKDSLDKFSAGDFSNISMLTIYILLMLVSIFISIWWNSCLYSALVGYGKKDIKEVFVTGYKNMGRYFLIGLLSGLAIFGGFILLIVPGIIFAIWFANSLFFAYDRKLGVIASMKESKKIIKGQIWKYLGISFVIGIFVLIASVVVSIIPYLGQFILSFLTPLFMLPYYLIYKDLIAVSRS